MASIVIGSVTAESYTTPDGVSPSAGVYYCTPKLGMGSPPWCTEKKFKEIKHLIPGVGIGTTRMGDFGPRTIHADLVFVDDSSQAAFGRYITALATFSAQARYNITVLGTTINGCKLVVDSVKKIGQIWMGGKSHLAFSFTFEELG